MCARTTSGMVPKPGPAGHGACSTNQEWISATRPERPEPHLRRKTPKPAAVEVAAAGESKDRSTLLAWDRRTGRSYLVDTGADVSVFPASLIDKRTRQKTDPLVAANGSTINTYGQRTIPLQLGGKLPHSRSHTAHSW